VDLTKIIINDGFAKRALPYIEHAYKVTGDIPGINYLLASFYLHSGYGEKAFRHLLNALKLDKNLYSDFESSFPKKLQTRKIKKLLKENGFL
jgi:hypothetical protein